MPKAELKKVTVGRGLYSSNPSFSLDNEIDDPSLNDLKIKELTPEERNVRSSKKQCKIM